MSKGIKVEDQVYEDLDALRGKGVTFSQVIQELLNNRESIFSMLNTLEGQVKFNEWKANRL